MNAKLGFGGCGVLCLGGGGDGITGGGIELFLDWDFRMRNIEFAEKLVSFVISFFDIESLQQVKNSYG